MDVRTVAVEALFSHLRDRLPGILAARDAVRRASVRCVSGPYTIPAGGTIQINGETFTLPTGPRTATELATAIGGVTFRAVAVDGRLVLESRDAPAKDAPSVLTVDGGTALEALGLVAEEDSVALKAVASPPPRCLAREPGSTTRIDDRALVFLPDSVQVVRERGLRDGLHLVTIPLEIWVPGSLNLPPEVAIDAAREVDTAIAKALADGDERGPFMLGGAGSPVFQATPSRLSSSPRAFELRIGAVTAPVGVCATEVQLRIQLRGQ
jgi:hypothetical protein